jgi:hypothetical protein
MLFRLADQRDKRYTCVLTLGSTCELEVDGSRIYSLMVWKGDRVSRFGVSPAPALTAVATTHLSELRLSRLALFTITHLDKLSIASAIQPQFNLSILPAHAPLHRESEA